MAKNAKYENGIKYIGDIAIDAETTIKTTEIKKGTRVIASSTFVNSTNLTSVVIPEGVTHIGDRNFKYSKKIEYVVLPKSLKSIGKECFDESTKITAVYYAGSEADKRDMTVQSSKLRSKTWYYNACLGKAEHTWDGGKTVSAATCTEKGSLLYTCTVCGATGKGETKALGHSLGSWKTVTATTCLAEGYEKKSCSRCNYYETRTVSALGHVYGAMTVSLEPTCTASGSESQACTRCGSTVTRSIPAKGHTFGTWEVTVEPTCTDEGTETKTCASCNATEERSVPAKGHSFGAWAHATDPTCTEWGTEKRSCSTCLTVETNEYRDPLGHSFGQKVITKEPNLWENGSASITCSVCDYTEETSVPCFASNEDGSITVEADEGVFGKDTVFGTTQLKWYHSGKGLAKEALKDISGKFITYEITTTVGEEEVRPNGVVTLSVAIPEGYGDAKLYRINGDGTATLLQTMIHNGMAVTTISETGLIVISQPGEYESSVNPVLIALCAVLTLALAVSSAVLIKALKKK